MALQENPETAIGVNGPKTASKPAHAAHYDCDKTAQDCVGSNLQAWQGNPNNNPQAQPFSSQRRQV